MEIQYYGANCVRLVTKKASITIDDNLKDLGLKSVTKKGDIVLFTGAHGEAPEEVKLVIDHPGEYEVSDTSVQAIAARAHIDEANQKSATMFKIIGEDVRVAVVGHIYPDLTDAQLEALGTVDVIIIPVGGNGFTLDPIGALKIIKKIEPKLVIPTHYHDDAAKYPVPQQTLADAINGLAMEAKEAVPKLKVKPGEMADVAQLVVLERQN
jgi:L-ascorbate metabolism protein UlaG (beta-lactamase superfamily)